MANQLNEDDETDETSGVKVLLFAFVLFLVILWSTIIFMSNSRSNGVSPSPATFDYNPMSGTIQ